jgi:hypothetical protein
MRKGCRITQRVRAKGLKLTRFEFRSISLDPRLVLCLSYLAPSLQCIVAEEVKLGCPHNTILHTLSDIRADVVALPREAG